MLLHANGQISALQHSLVLEERVPVEQFVKLASSDGLLILDETQAVEQLLQHPDVLR